MEQAPQQQRRMFGKQQAGPAPAGPGITDAISRMRAVEQRMSTIQRQMQVTEQNLITNDQRAHKELASLRAELSEVRRDMAQMHDSLEAVAKELRRTALRDDVQVIRKYLDLWQPVRFVTQEQVERIVRDALDKGKP